jgi:hypothetical protein
LYFFFNAVGPADRTRLSGISTYGLGSVWPAFKTPLAENFSKMIVGGALGTYSGSGPTDNRFPREAPTQ